VLALAMIFVYLFYEVAPVLRGATVSPQAQYALPTGDARPQHLLLERYEELGIQYDDQGVVRFFSADDGRLHTQVELPVPAGNRVTSFAAAEANGGVTALGLDNGQAVVARHAFDLSFPDDQRQITPKIEYPFGTDP